MQVIFILIFDAHDENSLAWAIVSSLLLLSTSTDKGNGEIKFANRKEILFTAGPGSLNTLDGRTTFFPLVFYNNKEDDGGKMFETINNFISDNKEGVYNFNAVIANLLDGDTFVEGNLKIFENQTGAS